MCKQETLNLFSRVIATTKDLETRLHPQGKGGPEWTFCVRDACVTSSYVSAKRYCWLPQIAKNSLICGRTQYVFLCNRHVFWANTILNQKRITKTTLQFLSISLARMFWAFDDSNRNLPKKHEFQHSCQEFADLWQVRTGRGRADAGRTNEHRFF